jgi:hypothetical protein
MVWRRLLLRSDHNIADLHYAIQISMGWSDSHLDLFHIHGKDYGVAHEGGIFSAMTPSRFAWLTSNFASGNVSYTNTISTTNNAPVVAFGVEANEISFPSGDVDYSKVHDQVVAIDPANMTVTLNLIDGFSFGRPIWYMSTDASTPLAAAIKHNTYAPLQASLPLGGDDTFSSESSSPRTDRSKEAATTRCGRACRPPWQTDSDRTTLWETSQH